MNHLFSTIVTAVVVVVAIARDVDRVLADDGKSFLTRYCADCHAGEKPDGGLRIDSLQFDANEPTSIAAWVRLFDRIKKGEMPPHDAPQPSVVERDAFLKTLHPKLHAASLERQLRDGRVLVRRLNRNEYENTLHDLLGITTDLKSLLPEDVMVSGFDNISTGLETSATHLVAYQTAADKALDAALPISPVSLQTRRVTGKQFFDGLPKAARDRMAPFVRLDGDALILHAVLDRFSTIMAPNGTFDGRYRMRASVRAVHNDGKPLSFLIAKNRPDRFARERLEHILAVRDAPSNESRAVEIETNLSGRELVYFEGLGLPPFQDLQKQLAGKPVGDEWPGPGLAFEWIELEGPLDAGVGYRCLFDEMPQVPSRFLADAVAGKPVPEVWKSWPNPSSIYEQFPLTPVSRDPRTDATRLMRGFLPRAFRRPVADATASYFIQVCHDELDKGAAFGEAMRAGYKSALCSPHFLMLIEKPGRLDDFAIASRLSYFLWSSRPDDELLAAASRGELSKPDVLRIQTERLLNDRKSQRFVNNFTGLWLELRRFQDMKPDRIYGEYDDLLAWSMPEETRQFFQEVLQHDLAATSFFHSDWSMLNERLARHYGIGNVLGMDFRRVALPPESHRGGVVTQASILKLTTNSTYSSPVKRGAWILDRMLGTPPSPPPPNVAAVEPDIRGAVTIREQLALHKSQAVCASCHAQIDPPGFALENFDVVGGWRENYRIKQGAGPGRQVTLANYPNQKVWEAKPVEAAGETAAGESFANIDDYKKLVLRNPNQLTRNLAEKLLTYGTGCTLQYADREAVEELVAQVKSSNLGFRSLIHTVVQNRVFQSK